MKNLWLRGTLTLAVASVALMVGATGAFASSDATVVRTDIGSGVGWHSGSASCPSGQFATGGGMALSGGSSSSSYQFISDDGPINSSGLFLETTTGTVPVSWYGTGYIEAGTADDYVWVICSPTRTTVVRETIGAGATTGFHDGYAKCPNGETASGGGLGIEGGSTENNYELITDDGPVNSTGDFVTTTTGTVPIQWYGTNVIYTSHTVGYVWAVCSHLATTVVRETIGAGATTGFHSGYARCTHGVQATGGGLGLKGGSSGSNYEIISDGGPTDSSGIFDDTTTGTVPVEFYGTNDLETTHTVGYVWAVCG